MVQQITPAVLSSINLGVSTAFNRQFGLSPSFYKRFCYEAPSTGSGEFYPRLDLLPGLREWIGDREINMLSQTNFQIMNRTFEGTIAVKREDIEDDKFGILAPAAEQLGQNAGNLPDLLVAQLLKNGHATPTYDGQNFFDVAHPDYTGIGAAGGASATTSANYFTANIPAGEVNGAPWYLFDTRQILKAVIFQTRRAFDVIAKFNPEDPDVFWQNQYVWGVDGRCSAGFGIWQTAVMSTAPLNQKNFALARTAMASHHRPDGSPLAILPTLCVVPTALLGNAKTTFGAYADSSINATTTVMENPWKDACEILENPWLN